MIFPRRQVPLRLRIPMVRVTLATDDGEVRLLARWNRRPIDLQRRILFLMRQGQTIFLEDEWGHGVCLRPECVWSARVDAVAGPDLSGGKPSAPNVRSGSTTTRR